MKKEELCAYLYYSARGRKRTLTSHSLETVLSVSGNELRKQVNRLRRDGIPIASSRDGYYFAENAGDVYSTIKNLKKMRDGLDAAIAGLEAAMEKFTTNMGGDAG